MSNIDFKKSCLGMPNEKFGQKRWCFEGETPKVKSETPAPKVDLSKIGKEVSEEESAAALANVKENRKERKEQLDEARARRAALAKSLELPGAKEEPGKKEEEGKKTEGPKIPERPKTAETGAAFMERIKDLPQDQREDEIYKAISSGNVPSFLRKLQNVKATFKGDDGKAHDVEYSVTPQGLAIGCGGPEDGCDKPDFIQIPMTPRTAQKLAKDFDMMLPTGKLMAGAFESNQFAKVVMDALPAGSTMSSNAFYQRHNELFHDALSSAGLEPTAPALGKKVITVEEGLDVNPNTLSFWGGLKPEGGFYQGGIEKEVIKQTNEKGDTVEMTVLKAKSSNAHDGRYVDYSHTAFLVSTRVKIDGEWMDQSEANQRFPGLLSIELPPGAQRQNPFNPFAYYGSENGLLGNKISTSEPGPEQMAFLANKKPLGAIAPSVEGSTTAVAVGSPATDNPRQPLAEVPVRDAAAPRSGRIHVGGGGEGMVAAGGGGLPGSGGEGAPIHVGGGSGVAPRERVTPVVEYSGAFNETPRVKAKVGPSDKENPISPERREKSERPVIKGNTLFCGDSITVGMPEAGGRRNVNVDGSITTIAEVSKDSQWLLEQVQSYEATGEINNMKNMVVLIGTNDIGTNRTAEQIFDNIQKIWDIGKKHGLKIYASTIPPVKGWSTWGDSGTYYEKTNEKRKEVNELIKSSALPDKIIDLAALVADPNDPDKLAQEYDGGDHLHLNKRHHARLLENEIGEKASNEEREVEANNPGAPPIDRFPTELHLIHGFGDENKENPPPAHEKAKVGTTEKEEEGSESNEEVELEFNYGLEGENNTPRTARLIKNSEGEFLEFEDIYHVVQRAKVDTSLGIIPKAELRKDYAIGVPGAGNAKYEISHLSYVILYMCIAMGKPQGTIVSYELNGESGVGRFETHNDGPNGPIPFDHPGVGVWHAI